MNAGEKSESSGNPVCEFLPHSVACVPDIVPKSDCRIGKVMFIAESAKACYVQHKKFPDEWFETEPASGEHSQEMSLEKISTSPLIARIRLTTRSARAAICCGDSP